MFDLFEQENTRANVELNKTRDVWAAESIVTRNQWVTSTKQKLIACETGEPVESLQGQASNVWTNLRSSLLGLTIPPLAILTVIWMASGFRAQAHRQQAAEAVVPVLLNLQQSVDDARLVHAGVNPQVAAQAALGQEATQAQQPQATETPQPDSPHPKAPPEQPPYGLSPRVQAMLADLGRAVASAAPANSMVQRSFGRGRPLKAPAESGDPTADDFRAVYSVTEWATSSSLSS